MPRRQAADPERVRWVADGDDPSPIMGFPTSAHAPGPFSKQADIRRQLYLQHSSLFSHPNGGNHVTGNHPLSTIFYSSLLTSCFISFNLILVYAMLLLQRAVPSPGPCCRLESQWPGSQLRLPPRPRPWQ